MTQHWRRTSSRHRPAPPSPLGDRKAEAESGRRCRLSHAETPQDRHRTKVGRIRLSPPEVESLETVRTSCCGGGAASPCSPSTAADQETEFTLLGVRPGGSTYPTMPSSGTAAKRIKSGGWACDQAAEERSPFGMRHARRPVRRPAELRIVAPLRHDWRPSDQGVGASRCRSPRRSCGRPGRG